MTYGPRGSTTTTVLQHPGNRRKSLGITRATSIRRRGPANRQQLLGVLAVTLLATCLFILLLLALNTSRECVQEPRPNVCMTEECIRTAASLLSAMDRTAAPCVNFFQYACGTWNRRHVIPEDRSSISTFEVLANQLQVILKRILEEPPNNEDNNATLKAKMFYKSCMDIRGSYKRDRRYTVEKDVRISWRLASSGWTIMEAASIFRRGFARSIERTVQRGSVVGTMGRSR